MANREPGMILIIIVITISAPDLRRLDPDTGQELEVKMSQSPTEELMSTSNTTGHREKARGKGWDLSGTGIRNNTFFFCKVHDG